MTNRFSSTPCGEQTAQPIPEARPFALPGSETTEAAFSLSPHRASANSANAQSPRRFGTDSNKIMSALLPCPVIFIPGITGSALRDQYPVDPEAVWSPFKLVVKAYERITLHPSDTRYELIEPARATADQVFGLVYSEFIEELRHNLSPQADQPVPVFPFAYDWRASRSRTPKPLSPPSSPR
jgi:hypothetical protein